MRKIDWLDVLPFVAASCILATVVTFVWALTSRPAYEQVYRVCDRAHLSNTGKLEEECARLLDKTNTEYICNTYCWLEVK